MCRQTDRCASFHPRPRFFVFVEPKVASFNATNLSGRGMRHGEAAYRSACDYIRRSMSAFLISAIALPGLSPFGQVRVQFMMV
jgi:hypothetical protein